MEYNFKMQRILNKFYKQEMPAATSHPIWKKHTLDGNAFYGLGNFCGIKTADVIEYGRELTDLEWNGNELDFHNDCFHTLITDTLSAYLSIKKQLENQYCDTVFDIVVSIDESSCRSNIRFYAVRNDYHYIEPTHENVIKFEMEAILIDTINRVCLTDYIPILTERFGRYADIMKPSDKQELQITNPYGDNHIFITWDEEFTMYFSDFHSHYEEASFEELVYDVEHILQEDWVCVTVHCEARWLLSSIGAKETFPLDSNNKLIQHLFSHNKEARKELKAKGGNIQLINWNPEKTITIVIDKMERI